jgi:YbbR domain-containing protein
MLRHNWTLKLASFGLAVFLWAVVQAEPVEREVLSAVPVRVQVGDMGWTLAGDPEPREVQVRFAGPVRQILDLDREGPMVRVPIETVTGPDTVIQLRRDWVVVGGGATLVVQEIVPASVRLRFEASRQVAVPLSVRTRGTLPRAIALAAPIGLTPQVVRVRGPARIVSDLDSIPLLPLDLAEVSGSGLIEVAVDTAGLTGLTLMPLVAQLGIRVESAVERLLPSVPVGVEGPAAAALEVQPTRLPVTLRGARGPLDSAELDSIRIEVPAARVQDIMPGESRRIEVRVRGVPPLLRAEMAQDSVTVRRPTGSGGAENEGDGAADGAGNAPATNPPDSVREAARGASGHGAAVQGSGP